MGDDMVDPLRGGLRHAACPARRANATPLTGEGNQLGVTAVTAAQAQEAVRADAAFEEDIEPRLTHESATARWHLIWHTDAS
jgi:hypothetical protein